MARNFCLLIAATALLYGSEEFILWAKFSAKDSSVIYDKIALSKAMTLSDPDYEYLCEIPLQTPPQEARQENLYFWPNNKRANEQTISQDEIKRTYEKNALEFLNLHKNELFECFLPYKFKVEDRFIQRNKNINSATDLTLFPVRFTVKFKPNSAIISVFKNKK